MSRARIESPVAWKEYSSFSSRIDLRADSPSGVDAATIIRVVTAGSGSMAVRMASHEAFTRQLTSFTAGEEIIGRFTSIEAENAAAEVVGFTAAQIATDGGLTDGDTITFLVDGGGTETALFETADFSDIEAPTLAEIKVVVEADTTATFDASGTYGKIVSPTGGSGGSIRITGGTAAAKLGFFDQSLHIGADTDVTLVRVGWSAQ